VVIALKMMIKRGFGSLSKVVRSLTGQRRGPKQEVLAIPQFLYQSMPNQSSLINQSVLCLTSHCTRANNNVRTVINLYVHVGRLFHPNLTLCNCCFSSVAGNSYTNSQSSRYPVDYPHDCAGLYHLSSMVDEMISLCFFFSLFHDGL
jgi:hypothetical protein